MGRGVSQRRACRLLSVARSALGYESRVASRDAPVLAAMRELARQYPRYGYRRIQVFLARRGFAMSAERAYRLWRQAQLQVPRRRPRRRIASRQHTIYCSAEERAALGARAEAAGMNFSRFMVACALHGEDEQDDDRTYGPRLVLSEHEQ